MRIGLIGFEGHSHEILNATHTVDGARLVAIAKARPDEPVPDLKGFGSVTESTRFFEDPVQMLDEVKPDIVGVTPANFLIARYAQAAAKRGIHVIAEKPLAATKESLERLQDAVESAGVQCVALLAMRHFPPFAAVHQAVKDGLIGDPILITAQKSYRWGSRPEWYKKRDTYGGTIPWVAIHAIDYVRWCSGLEYEQVSAYHSNVGHTDYPGCEDNGGMVFKMDNDGTALINFDYLRPAAAPTHGDDRLRIAGSRGIIEIKDTCSRVELTTHDDGPRDLELPQTTSLLADFVTAVKEGRSPLVTTEDSFRVTKVALRARQAADTGRTLPLTTPGKGAKSAESDPD